LRRRPDWCPIAGERRRAIMRTLISLACAAWLLCWSGGGFAQTPNACGCYTDDKGQCKCSRKVAKCGCPGECEPVGCEAKREKQAEKEAAAELRRIAAREKKKADDAVRAAKEKKKAEETAAKAASLKEGEKRRPRPTPPPDDIFKDLP
jgi:hypothetical protein